jgi:hypothetical protein
VPFGNLPAFGLGSGLLRFENSAEVLFDRRQKLLVTERSARVLVGTQDLEVLFANDPREEPTPGGRQLEQGSDACQRVVPAARVGCCAAPPLTGRRARQPRAHRIELDVTRSGQ